MLHTKRRTGYKRTNERAKRTSAGRQRKCHFTACLTAKWTLSCEYDDGDEGCSDDDDDDDDYDDGGVMSNKRQAN